VSPPLKLATELREQVRSRAGFLCEYCHTSERWQYVRFTLDHVVPIREGGNDAPENLALACFHCNRRKSNNQTAADPESAVVVPLFNPRTELWGDHFRWSKDGLLVIPQTAVGRATVALLELNRERISKIRRADVEVGRHPPDSDLIAQ
jgi:HNH endonuclease